MFQILTSMCSFFFCLGENTCQVQVLSTPPAREHCHRHRHSHRHSHNQYLYPPTGCSIDQLQVFFYNLNVLTLECCQIYRFATTTPRQKQTKLDIHICEDTCICLRNLTFHVLSLSRHTKHQTPNSHQQPKRKPHHKKKITA